MTFVHARVVCVNENGTLEDTDRL